MGPSENENDERLPPRIPLVTMEGCTAPDSPHPAAGSLPPHSPHSSLISHSPQVPHFSDEPRWTRLEAGMDPGVVWPAVVCPEWAQQAEVTCEER